MNVIAIVIVGGNEDNTGQFAGIPLPLFDVMGRSVLVRVLERLDDSGIVNKILIASHGLPLPRIEPTVRIVTSDRKDLWETAVRVCSEVRRDGAEILVPVSLGPYVEIDYDQLLRFHFRQNLPVTAVVDPGGRSAMTFACTTSRELELTYLLRHRLQAIRHPYSLFRSSGYSNDLSDVSALRRLSIDAFCGNANIVPDAYEVRPGVWISSSASIHPRARVLAPAYIGEHAKVRDSAIVTRCSVVEHHAEIGAGVVLENATVLPNTIIGHGLDVTHSVVGLKRLFHLGRSIEIEMNDKRFVSQVSTAPVRFVEQLASFAVYLPAQFLRGLTSSNGKDIKAHEPSMQLPEPELAPANREQFPADLAGVRRYGED